MDLAFLSFAILLTIFATSACWLFLRFTTGSTKYAWALSLAVGYTVGHISLVAFQGVAAETFSEKISAWAGAWPASAIAVFQPTYAIDWLPMGALLAGLVSVNAAAFGFERVITIVGASLISVLLALELAGSQIADTKALFSIESGLPVLLGIIALWVAWLSLHKSIQGKSRWIWISNVAILTIAVIGVLWLSGANLYAMFGMMIFASLLGGMLVAGIGKGTDNIRHSGAFIAASSVGLLLSCCWFTEMPWYPVAILMVGFLAVGCWLPPFVMKLPYARTSLSIICSIAAMVVTALV